MNSPWEYIWVGLVLTVIGGVVLGAGLTFADPTYPIGFVVTLGGLGVAMLGGVVAGIGVIGEGVRLGNQQRQRATWAPPQRVD